MQDRHHPIAHRARIARRIAAIAGTAVLLAALPVAAQERGTVELGGYLSYSSFGSSYEMNAAPGLGGRVGVYVAARIAIELDADFGTAGRPSPLADRSFRFVDARVLLAPVHVGRLAVLLGVGGGHVDANVSAATAGQAYGYHVMAGGRIALHERAGVRIDYTRYYNAEVEHSSLKAGLSLFRLPARATP